MTDNDDLFDLIEIHRAVYAALCKAEDDFNADPLDDASVDYRPMHRALDIHRRVYNDLIFTRPRTVEGMTALISYVGEVSQHRKDLGDGDEDGLEILTENLKEVVRLAP